MEQQLALSLNKLDELEVLWAEILQRFENDKANEWISILNSFYDKGKRNLELEVVKVEECLVNGTSFTPNTFSEIEMLKEFISQFKFFTNVVERQFACELPHYRIRTLQILLHNPNLIIPRKLMLHATMNGNEGMVKMLLEYSQKDPRIDPSYNENEAFIFAVNNCFINIVKLFLEYSIKDPRIDPSTHSSIALKNTVLKCRGGKNIYDKLLRLFLDHSLIDPRIDLSVIYSTVLGEDVRGRIFPNVYITLIEQSLKDPRIDLSVYDNEIICLACQNGLKEIVKTLLERSLVDHRINPSARSNQPLYNSFRCGFIDIFKMLLEHSRIDSNIDPSANNNQLINDAHYFKNREVVNLLLKEKRVCAKLTWSEKIYYSLNIGF